MFFGVLEQGNDNSSDNCTTCKKALLNEKAKKKISELKEKGKIEF